MEKTLTFQSMINGIDPIISIDEYTSKFDNGYVLVITTYLGDIKTDLLELIEKHFFYCIFDIEARENIQENKFKIFVELDMSKNLISTILKIVELLKSLYSQKYYINDKSTEVSKENLEKNLKNHLEITIFQKNSHGD